MKKRIVITLLLAGVTGVCFAQKQVIEPAKLKEQVPDVSFTVTEAGVKTVRKLSNYKGKIVLLDFWGVNCLDCIAAMPKMLDFQQRYKDNLQIIIVTRNTEEQISKLWKKLGLLPDGMKWINAGKQLPFITNDSVLQRIFPYKGLPTHVWIGKESEYVSMAYSTSTTEGNIQKLVKGHPVNWDQISGVELNADTLLDNPFLWLNDQNYQNRSIPYFSFIGPRIEFGEGGYGPVKVIYDSATAKARGVSCMNKTIIELYKEAYRDKLPFKPFIPNNRIVLEANDQSKYFAPRYDSNYYSWASRNLFCYALKCPVKLVDSIYPFMRKDLDRFFNLTSKIEKRNIKCWVFKQINTEVNFVSKNGKARYEREKGRLLIRNSSIKNLTYAIEDLVREKYPDMPVIDVTDYTGNIDIDLPWSDDLKTLSIIDFRKEMQKFGLDIVEEYFPIEMLVISEKPKK